MSDTVAAMLSKFRDNPEVDAVQWLAADCPDCHHLDGLEWTLDGRPLGHDILLTGVPPLRFGCRAILVPIGRFRSQFDSALRQKAFDEADALIDTTRRDRGSDAWRRLKAEVAGRRAAHQAGKRFVRKKFLPEEFW